MKKSLVSIIIPSYNGQSLLESYLPSVIEASEQYGNCEIIVVDDGSTDETVEYLVGVFPTVRLIALKENSGYGNAVNTGVKNCKGEIVVLLNNDVAVDRHFISPLVRHFEDKSVFSVAAKSLVPDMGMVNESVTRLQVNNGKIALIVPGLVDPQCKFEDSCTVIHSCGGFSVFDKTKFMELGGFDELFHPFYWEDADLCYRAWKRGWWVLYEPQSVVYHHRHGTIGKIKDKASVDRIYVRNNLLFIWKNITDEEILIAHAKWLNSYLKDAPELFTTAFYAALKKIMMILKKRKEQPVVYLKDTEILKLSSNLKFPEEALMVRKQIGK